MNLIFLFLIYVIQVYQWVFIVYLLLSWFPVNRNNFLVRMIDSVCEPLYSFFLRFLPRLIIGPIDLSPIYVFIFLEVLRRLLGFLMMSTFS